MEGEAVYWGVIYVMGRCDKYSFIFLGNCKKL